MHIIEEKVLFHDSQPVQHIELDTEKVWWGAERENRPSLFYCVFSWCKLITSAVNAFIGSLEIP